VGDVGVVSDRPTWGVGGTDQPTWAMLATCQKFRISTGPPADPCKKRILYMSHDVASNVGRDRSTDVGDVGDGSVDVDHVGDVGRGAWAGRLVSSVPRVLSRLGKGPSTEQNDLNQCQKDNSLWSQKTVRGSSRLVVCWKFPGLTKYTAGCSRTSDILASVLICTG
jgi:hypothetical protein